MAYTPLVKAWNDSRETRADMPTGRRVASIEHDLADGDGLADMSPGRSPGWLDVFAALFADPEPDEPEVQG